MGVVVGSPLLLGESVRIQFLLPHMTSPVRATAVVRYQRQQCFGLQFLRLPVEQQSIIRYWTRCEAELLFVAQKSHAAQTGALLGEAAVKPAQLPYFQSFENSKRKFRIPHILALTVPIIVVAALLGWRWQQEGTALETPILGKETVAEQPQFKVPAEEMQWRVRHQVTPDYPEDARQAGVQGTVVLDAVVSAEGNVTQVKFVSGPEALSLAATDAVRWWRYEPYLVNGRPATVETTVVLNFRLAN
jgi:TonB family protein